MKRIISLLLIILLSSSVPLSAAELEADGTALRKLQRGVLNFVFSPFELSNELHKEKEVDTFLPSWVGGLGRGTFYMVGRAFTGLVEIVTFPIPVPENYEPIIYPEFAWEHLENDDD